MFSGIHCTGQFADERESVVHHTSDQPVIHDVREIDTTQNFAPGYRKDSSTNFDKRSEEKPVEVPRNMLHPSHKTRMVSLTFVTGPAQ